MHKEIEFKYDAEHITLDQFKSIADSLKAGTITNGTGIDHFYAKDGDVASFYRHRVGSGINQLTFKKKTSEDNSFIRVEHNLDLLSSFSEDDVKAYCDTFGYKYNTTLHKNSFNCGRDHFMLTYYICYEDSSLKEIGRFIEIEMNEHFDWESEKQAFNSLVMLEKVLKRFGLTPDKRISKSLFEMYRKEIK